MAGVRFQSRMTQYSDDNGDPLNSGKLFFYVSGTSTLQDTFSDAALDPGDANTNPVILDADGRTPVDIFLDSTLNYRAVLKTSADVTVADDDPVGGNDATTSVEAHNDDLAAHYAATESQRGFVELANSAEAAAGTDTARAITAATLKSAVRAIFFPVGTIYTTITATNPGTYIGGTWTAFGSGRTLVGLDAGQTEFDTVEETGGSKTVTLTTTELPAHTHFTVSNAEANNDPLTAAEAIAYRDNAGGDLDYELSGNSATATIGITSSAGTGSAFNNMNPYVVVYFWKRTA